MTLNLQQLAIATGAGLVRAQNYIDHIVEATDAYGIDTAKRMAAFLAQVGHESASLRFTTELWGPDQVPAQITYERDFDAAWPPAAQGERNWKAFKLGNVNAGDGYKFRGHGLIQVTGRANHAAARDRLRVKLGFDVPDFEAEPEHLAEPRWAALSAADFWAGHGLNELADAGNFERITRVINGGLNGYADRLARLKAAQNVIN